MAETETTDGFPYFWLGAEAESISTPWYVEFLKSLPPTTRVASIDGCLYRINALGLWEYAGAERQT